MWLVGCLLMLMLMLCIVSLVFGIIYSHPLIFSPPPLHIIIHRHKVPPRNLLNLAQRYHTEITLQPLMAQASSIALLQPPPSWGLASSADADWVIRQRMREEYGLTKKKKLNRHQRKKKLKLSAAEASSSSSSSGTSKNSSASVIVSTELLLFDKPSIQALIASGTGPDGRLEARKLRKKRRGLPKVWQLYLYRFWSHMEESTTSPCRRLLLRAWYHPLCRYLLHNHRYHQMPPLYPNNNDVVLPLLITSP